MSGPPTSWSSGALYEPYVGRWSRLVAREFVDWLGVRPGARWLDVGCGTGALSAIILDRSAPDALLGVDPSAGYVEHAREYLRDPRARFEIGDAQRLPVATGTYDAVVAGLVLNFVPQPVHALMEMRRAAVPGAVVAVYVWDYAGQMQMMRHFWDAAVALDPAAADLDEGRRFPLCDQERLAEAFHAADMPIVDTRAIDVPTVFRDFDDYWAPFLGGQAPAPGYCMSLSEDRRQALRERIRAHLPFELDGSIHLIARAWAAQARVA